MSRVRRDITWAAICWDTVQVFTEERKALKALKDAYEKQASVPKAKNTNILKVIYDLEDNFRATHGSIGPIYYLVSPADERDETLPEEAPPLTTGRLFGGNRSSITEELMARASRSTAEAIQDKETMFNILVTCFSGTQYANAAKQYEKSRDGKAFWEHICETYAHSDIHEAEAKKAQVWLQTNQWGGPHCGSWEAWLEKHVRQYDIILRSSKHCHVTVFSDRVRVGHILDNCTSKDPDILTSLSSVKSQDGSGKDLRNNMKECVLFLSQCNYAGKNKTGKKKARVQAEVGALGGGGGGSGQQELINGKTRYQAMLDLKGGRGPRTGVDLRYHSRREIGNLNQAQKDELFQWRATELKKLGYKEPPSSRGKRGNGGGGNESKKKGKISSAVSQAIEPLVKGFSDRLATMEAAVKSMAGFAPAAPATAAATSQQEAVSQAMLQAGLAELKKQATTGGRIGAVVADTPTNPASGEVMAVTNAEGTQVGTALLPPVVTAALAKLKGTDGIDAQIAASAAVGLNSILRKNGSEKKNDASVDWTHPVGSSS